MSAAVQGLPIAGAVAVPFAVANCTVTVCVLAADRLTGNTALTEPALPSVTVTSLIDSAAVSCCGDPAGQGDRVVERRGVVRRPVVRLDEQLTEVRLRRHTHHPHVVHPKHFRHLPEAAHSLIRQHRSGVRRDVSLERCQTFGNRIDRAGALAPTRRLRRSRPRWSAGRTSPDPPARSPPSAPVRRGRWRR